MCMKMMTDGGWAQQLGGHACPRHRSHPCRHSPHRLRRLGAASTRSRWKAALVDRWCWFSRTKRFLEKMRTLCRGQVWGGEAGAEEPSAEGSRPPRKLVTTRANNVPKRGSSAIIFTAFPFGTCTPEGTPHIPVERYITVRSCLKFLSLMFVKTTCLGATVLRAARCGVCGTAYAARLRVCLWRP